ncbi:hypothetical protein JCM8547_008042 [Rhodosporidiobolus lusitaniae]
MFWRSIPRATDVLSRPEREHLPSPPSTPASTHHSIAKPPLPSAPPLADSDHEEDARRPARQRRRRFSLGGGNALQRAVQQVIEEEREKKRDEGEEERAKPAYEFRDVVLDAMEQEQKMKKGKLGKLLKRRKSVGELLGLRKKQEDEEDDDESGGRELGFEPPLVTPFRQHLSDSGSSSGDGSSSEEENPRDEGERPRRGGQPPQRETQRPTASTGHRSSPAGALAPRPPATSRRFCPRPPSPISPPSESSDDESTLPPAYSSPSSLPPLPTPPTLPSSSSPSTLPSFQASARLPHPPALRRATTAYEPYEPYQARAAPGRPAPPRRDTSPSFSPRPGLNPYEQAIRRAVYADSDEESDTGSDRSSTLSPSSRSDTGSEGEDYGSDVASSLAPAPPSSSISYSAYSAQPVSLPRRPSLLRTQSLPPPPPRPPLPPGFPSFPKNATPTPPITGLTNLGNSCYINAVLQCLASTKPLADFFLSGDYEKELNLQNRFGSKGELAKAAAHLFRVMFSGEKKFVSPARLRNVITRIADRFDDHAQHDAHEFLLTLLDALHEDVNLVLRPPPVKEKTPEREAELERLPEAVAADQEWAEYRARQDSAMVDFFQGQIRNRMECMSCMQTSTTFSPIQALSLSIPTPTHQSQDVSLTACIDQFLNEEILTGENAWNCPRCQCRRAASKRLCIARLPQFLVIHLKRFEFDSFTSKITTPVSFPLDDLELGGLLPPMVFSPQYRLNCPHERKTTYRLYGVCAHLGGDGDGHYKAVVRRGERWIEVDDEKVRELNAADVAPSFSTTAFLLFFEIAR